MIKVLKVLYKNDIIKVSYKSFTFLLLHFLYVYNGFKRKTRLNSKFISKISADFSVRPNIRPSGRIVGHSFDLVLNQSLSYKSTYAMNKTQKN